MRRPDRSLLAGVVAFVATALALLIAHAPLGTAFLT